MRENIGIHKFHEELAKDIFTEVPNDIEVLCFILLIHTSHILLSINAKIEGGGTGFEPITARHASEIIARIFRKKDVRKSNYEYWYTKWCGDWEGGRLLNEIPKELKPGLQKMKELIEAHPWVQAIEDEDFDIIKEL